MTTPGNNLGPLDIGAAAQKLTDSISSPLERLYTVGGYVLVFTFVGLFLMLVAYFTEQKYYSPYLFGFGAAIEILCFVGIFAAKIYAQQKTNTLIKENQDLIKTFLELTSKLLDNLTNLESLLHKNTEFVKFLLQEIEPILSQIPVLNTFDLSQGKNVNAAIIDAADKIREIVDNTRLAILEAKVEPLKRYVNELETLKFNIREALRRGNSIKTLNYKEMFESYQTAIAEYALVVEDVTDDAMEIFNKVDALFSVIKIIPGASSKVALLSEQITKFRSITKQLNETTTKLNVSLESGNFSEIREILDSFKTLSQSIKSAKSKKQSNQSSD